MADVFISYSSKDREKAEDLVAELEKNGITYWIDSNDLQKGNHYDDVIPVAISDSKYVVLLISENSISSNDVKNELRLAVYYKKQIIPFMLSNVELSEAFIYHIQANSRIMADGNWYGAIQQLLCALEPVIRKPSGSDSETEPVIKQIDYSGEILYYTDTYDGKRQIRCPKCQSKYLVHEDERLVSEMMDWLDSGKLPLFTRAILIALAGSLIFTSIAATMLNLDHIIPTDMMMGLFWAVAGIFMTIMLVIMLVLLFLYRERIFADYQISKANKKSRIYFDRRYVRTLRCMSCKTKCRISIPLKEQKNYYVFLYDQYSYQESL